MTSTCSVCVNAFTGVVRKEICCPHCDYSSCVQCLKQYILNINQDPMCMQCHAPFDREFLDLHFSRAFMSKQYKRHRENILLEREKSKLPATMPFVEQELHRRRNEKEIAELKETLQTLSDEHTKNNERIENEYFVRIQMFRKEHIEKINHMRLEHLEKIKPLQHEINCRQSSNATTPVTQRREFVKACVVNGCRGFLSTQWKCGVCETRVCSQCHEIKANNEHICDASNVASAKLITKETKPCPKCASHIYRVSGCYQMWCPQCHTTFDWNNGREIITDNVHNPHYFEWLQRNGNAPREEKNGECDDGLPPLDEFMDSNWLRFSLEESAQRVRNLYRSVRHLSHFIRQAPIENEVYNRTMRVQFLLNEIDEAKWKRAIQIRAKKIELQTAQRQVCEMLITVASDLFRKIMYTQEKEATLDEIASLVQYYKESLSKVYERFNSQSKVYTLDNDWQIYM